MDLKSRKQKLKRLLNKLFKNGIDLKEVTDKDEEQLLHPSALKKFEKLVKRALERPKIIEESKRITEKMKERVFLNKKAKQLKQQAKNEVFLDKHPQFKQVFKYDHKHNKSGDAELTAKSYMDARKKRLVKELNANFEFSDKFKDKLERQIMNNDYSIDLLEAMEQISQYLIYKKDSDPSDITFEFGIFDSPDDEFANRLLNRFFRVRQSFNMKSRK